MKDISKNQLEKHSEPIENDKANASKRTSKKLEFLNILSLEAKEILNKIKKLDKDMDHSKLFFYKQMERSMILMLLEV